MLAEYNQDLANEIVFSLADRNDNTIPHGCSVNLLEKRAYFREVNVIKWSSWDRFYKKYEWEGIIPDNSCSEWAFNGVWLHFFLVDEFHT